MKGHNYGECSKCNKIHKHPKGMKGKRQSEEFREKQRKRLLKDNPMSYEFLRKKASENHKGCKRPDMIILNKLNLTGKTFEELYGIKRAKDIRKRIKSSLTGKYVKENSFNWHGGLSFIDYPSEFNEQLRQDIRGRDKFTCQICKRKKKECFKLTNKDLCIHHINYDKKNNNNNNLITLCNICHLKTNSNRDYWKEVLSRCVEATVQN